VPSGADLPATAILDGGEHGLADRAEVRLGQDTFEQDPALTLHLFIEAGDIV